MKILINRKPVQGPWGGGNLFVRAFCDALGGKGHTVVHELSDDIDVIFMQDPRYSDLGISIDEVIQYKKHRPETKVIHRVNECDARKGTQGVDSLLQECSRHTDKTIFVSDWMKRYHLDRGWQCNDTAVVYNGVNLNHFKLRDKISNGKVNIVTHHWSNNRMKGFDVYEAIDKFIKNRNFTFTYIGRDLGTFKNTSVLSPLCGVALGEQLSKYDVYISGSLYDPGPNHILESIACGLPTYAIQNGGGASEFVGNDHTYSDIHELFKILETGNFSKNKLYVGSWKSCIEKYEKEIL